MNNSLKGFEFFSGIPSGSVGGAIKMNAGCYGFETKDRIESIEAFNINFDKKIMKRKHLDLKLQII